LAKVFKKCLGVKKNVIARNEAIGPTQPSPEGRAYRTIQKSPPTGGDLEGAYCHAALAIVKDNFPYIFFIMM
jgi:hypothetical protein